MSADRHTVRFSATDAVGRAACVLGWLLVVSMTWSTGSVQAAPKLLDEWPVIDYIEWPALDPCTGEIVPCPYFSGVYVPDCRLAVGPSHVVALAGGAMLVFDKDGNPYCWGGTSTLAYFGAEEILYDQYANRFLMVGIDERSYELWVSQSSDPTGSWTLFVSDASMNGDQQSANRPSDVRLGIDEDAIYVTSNMIGPEGTYAKIRIFKKSEAYDAGATELSYVDFWGMTNEDGSTAVNLQPAHTFGESDGEYLLSRPVAFAAYVTLWRITDPVGTPLLSRSTVVIRRDEPPSFGPIGAAQPEGKDQGVWPYNLSEFDRITNVVYRGGFLWAAHTKWAFAEDPDPGLGEDHPFGFLHTYNGYVRRAEFLQVDPHLERVVWSETVGEMASPRYDHTYAPAVMVDKDGHMFCAYNQSSLGRWSH